VPRSNPRRNPGGGAESGRGFSAFFPGPGNAELRDRKGGGSREGAPWPLDRPCRHPSLFPRPMAVGADHERGGYDFDRLAQRDFAGAIGRQKTLAPTVPSLSGGPGAVNLPAPGRTGGGPGSRVAASEARKGGTPGGGGRTLPAGGIRPLRSFRDGNRLEVGARPPGWRRKGPPSMPAGRGPRATAGRSGGSPAGSRPGKSGGVDGSVPSGPRRSPSSGPSSRASGLSRTSS